MMRNDLPIALLPDLARQTGGPTECETEAKAHGQAEGTDAISPLYLRFPNRVAEEMFQTQCRRKRRKRKEVVGQAYLCHI